MDRTPAIGVDVPRTYTLKVVCGWTVTSRDDPSVNRFRTSRRERWRTPEFSMKDRTRSTTRVVDAGVCSSHDSTVRPWWVTTCSSTVADTASR